MFIPLRRTSQCNQHPGCATLYLDCSAASEDLFDTARTRLESAIGTLSVLDLLDETEDRRKHRRITGSLLSLLSDALSLFEAEYARRQR
ncbi:hypothetical protein [Pseudomonas aeruginosa]|uniref:hypothetical protein n=1 Tax=Pseudomonas aeruginosa TaxID=287 RepID=UPI0009A929CA|nr:hypothetical protein [Pseudomonas aeruginosa]